MHVPKDPGIPPTPADSQGQKSPPGKPIDGGGERVLTGTPDESAANDKLPMYQPIADAVDRLKEAGDLLSGVVGGVLPNPVELVEGLGAIFSDPGKYDVLTNPQAKEIVVANGWSKTSPDNVKKAAGDYPVFYNPKDGLYYSPDKTGRRADNAWKIFDKKGNRLGTAIWDGKQMVRVSK
ncbi:hypothetical protein QTN24_12780 [Cupriavidus sp. SZY C1]|uniref:hypothetical protein n=1 Tax=Cupriavidus sp. SZY C1 TaxID=3055037 RepID=UPI0028B95933|nr:hypothetical protein [Cupriavidus sp. SZY C1]MDT6962375.1 hypothetical protein [Cupriavidus sp. SZY C1]